MGKKLWQVQKNVQISEENGIVSPWLNEVGVSQTNKSC